MTPTEMRVALAEACGWHSIKLPWGQLPGYAPTETPIELVPDYPGDLNACHEAEKGLTDDQLIDYGIALMATTRGNKGTTTLSRIMCATALQRAEALLRVLRPEIFNSRQT